jgi:carbon dioxide concentrating mechanism protein CcmO
VNDQALGLAEVAFLSLTALIADEMVKAADVRLLGIETTGNENLQIRIQGSVASVSASLAAAESRAVVLGAKVLTHVLARPSDALESLVHSPNARNPLYGGRDQFLPTDFPQPQAHPMNGNEQALGILETQGLTAVLEATDVMLKAANVTLVGKEKIGAAYVTVMIRGDVAAVTAAIEAGAAAVDGLGKLIAARVIPRPHDDLLALLPK